MMDDELLSAYVDGELSDAELVAVEVRLRDDPRARQLVAELRGVSETLRSLPKHKLGADLRQEVLQQAVTHREPVPADTGSVRKWAWAALALAATLLLTVYLPDAGQEKQQLAQANAKKREAEPPLPQLVAPADKPEEVARLVTETASAPPASNEPLTSSELLEGSVVFDAEADQVAPAAENLAFGGSGGTLSGMAVQSRQAQPDDESSAEAFEVHLTPGDPQVDSAQFDQLLASHGIALRERGNDRSARVGGASTLSADGKADLRSADKPTTTEAELVLVEAPSEAIQKIIADCSGDDSPWKSLRLVGQRDSISSLALLAEEKLKSPSPVETGVAIALDGLHLDDDLAKEEAPKAEEQPQSFAQQQAAAPAQGWATHLGRGRLATRPEPESAQNKELADLGASVQGERRDERSGPPATIRVLFILHPAAE